MQFISSYLTRTLSKCQHIKTPGQLSALCALQWFWHLCWFGVCWKSIHINIYEISGGLIVWWQLLWQREIHYADSLLLANSGRVGTRVRDATYHCHLRLSLQVSLFGKSCQLECFTTQAPKHLKTDINRHAAHRGTVLLMPFFLTTWTQMLLFTLSDVNKCKQIRMIISILILTDLMVTNWRWIEQHVQ